MPETLELFALFALAASLAATPSSDDFGLTVSLGDLWFDVNDNATRDTGENLFVAALAPAYVHVDLEELPGRSEEVLRSRPARRDDEEPKIGIA